MGIGGSLVFLKITKATTKINKSTKSAPATPISPFVNTAYCKTDMPADKISPTVAGRKLFKIAEKAEEELYLK